MSPIDCPFCSISNDRIISDHEFFFTIRDKFPVTEGHSLIISKRHVSDYFDLFNSEKKELTIILDELAQSIKKQDPSVTGFNIGINAGADAGQTVMHFHQHLIPRRKGDVANPRGGCEVLYLQDNNINSQSSLQKIINVITTRQNA